MTPPPPFAFGSGDSFDEVRDCLPPRLLALAAKGPALLSLESPVVAVAGLAHLAASLGRSCFFDDGSSRLPPCFSLAVLTDSLLPTDWLSLLGRGWVADATRLQNMDSAHLRAVIKNTLRDIATKGPDRSSIDPQFEAYAEKLPLTVVNMMRRRTILSKVDPDAATRAVVDSRDHCAVIMNGAGDPMAEWAQLPPGKQQKLTDLLKLGWQGKPLTVTSKGGEVPGTVHTMWLTGREPVRSALFDRRRSIVNRAAPVLLFQQHGNPKRLPEVDAAEFVEWFKCLKAALDYRCNADQENPPTISINKQARLVAEEFTEQFAYALARVPESLHPHLSWLPDLQMRLFNILLLSKSIERLLDTKPAGVAHEQPKPDPNELQTTMRQAVQLTRWMCQEHYRVVCSFEDAASADTIGPATDSTDMAALEQVILAKLKDKGPQGPRELQRTFHSLSAQTRDSAIQSLKSKGLVADDPDGILRQVA